VEKGEKWTQKKLEAHTPSGKRETFPDPENPGLFLIVHPSGSKTFCMGYRMGGRASRYKPLTLGRLGQINLGQARDLYRKNRGLIAQGIDPALKAKEEMPTLAKFAETFKTRYKAEVKASTWRTYVMLVERYILPALGKHALDAITPQDVADFHHGLREKPRTANQALAVLSVMLECAMAWKGFLPRQANPCKGLKRYKEPKRHRFLTPEELERVVRVLETWPNPYTQAAMRLALFTGMRHGEILAAKWEHVDEVAGLLALPEHKTDARGERVVVLAQEAVEALKSLPRKEGSPYVFAGAGKDGTIGSTFSSHWQKLRVLAGVPDVRLHDLRHTYASMGIASGYTLAEVGQLLGHSTPLTTSRYAHLVTAHARSKANAIAGAIKGKAPEGA
jgi:integrase